MFNFGSFINAENYRWFFWFKLLLLSPEHNLRSMLKVKISDYILSVSFRKQLEWQHSEAVLQMNFSHQLTNPLTTHSSMLANVILEMYYLKWI